MRIGGYLCGYDELYYKQVYFFSPVLHMSSTTRLYLAGLGPDPDKRQVEKEFSYYGRLDDVWLSKPPFGYGFVQFKSSRDGR